MISAAGLRLLNLGRVSPLHLHAAYTGLAEVLPENAEYGWLILARSDVGHIALGASQFVDAELDVAACARQGVPIVQRRLGGGTVWVDDGQLCAFFIVPRDQQRKAFFERCLEIFCAMFVQLGIAVERVGEQDIWAEGAKLLGSGGATIGHAQVFGASVLERFDSRMFAACVAASSAGYREWLADLLATQMTDLRRLNAATDESRIISALHEACAAHWPLREVESLAEREKAAVAAARAELSEPLEAGGRRLVRNGIKINRRTYLFEDAMSPWLRLVWRDGALDRAAAEDADAAAVLAECMGVRLQAGVVASCAVSQGMSVDRARELDARVLSLCRDAGK